ncbi:MAG: GTPase HflX [Bradymonadales bacterium]|jgi:GTP-binding protein HflX
MSAIISGNTAGLNARQLEALQDLEKIRTSPQAVVHSELAHRMCFLSDSLNRKLAVFISRSGYVESIMLGDAKRVFLSDIGRSRAGAGRLRGMRLIVTALGAIDLATQDIIALDEVTDLIKLRLDLLASIEVQAGGFTGRVALAHVLPSQKGVQHAVECFESLEDLPENIDESIRAWEIELGGVTQQGVETGETPTVLVHLDTGEADAKERLDEMLELCRTAGVEVVKIISQRRRSPDPRTVVGSGKLQELELIALDLDAQVLVFDRDLAPSQSRAISNIIQLAIIDRTQLILDIFAQRATSADGKLQVELAQLKYNLPKLVQKDTAMSRLAAMGGAMGSIGSRGPGETKLEINRRRARERMQNLEKKLKSRETHRQLQRKSRRAKDIPIFSFVGYTNAGKSTLLNALTKAEVLTEDKLFATLDPTTRRMRFPKFEEVIFTDTVGFIRDLPKDLVAAFKATLEELYDADVLLHVIDASSQQLDSQVKSVEAILKDLGLEQKPCLRILNKCDIIAPERALDLAQQYEAIPISALYQSSTLPLIEELQRFYLGETRLNADYAVFVRKEE